MKTFKIVLILTISSFFYKIEGTQRNIPEIYKKTYKDIVPRFFNTDKRFSQLLNEVKLQQSPYFKQSTEKEIEEIINYSRKIGLTENEMQKSIFSEKNDYCFDLLNRREFAVKAAIKCKNIDENQTNFLKWFLSEKGICDIIDFQKTFDKLKNIMHIAEDVKIMICVNQSQTHKDVEMAYNTIDRTIYIYPNIINHTKSNQLFALIHELSHAQQHMRNGALKFLLIRQQEKEREADTKSAQMIKCPLCMKAISYNALMTMQASTNSELKEYEQAGYLTEIEKKYFATLKDIENLCNHHKQITTKQPSILKSNDWQDVLEIEFTQPGSMFDRLSTVRPF